MVATLATIDELAQHLNLTDRSVIHGTELPLVLDAASEMVESLIRDLDTRTVTETVPVIGGRVILSERPTGDVLVGGSPIGGMVDQAAGIVTGLPVGYGYNYSAPAGITVTYEAGSGVVPSQVKLATLIVAAHLWGTQRGATPLTPMGGDTVDFNPGLGFALPNRAKELLTPYLRTTAQLA